MSQNLEDYDVITVVGTGSFGTCYKVRHKITKQIYVWKAIRYGELSDEKKKLLVSEVNLLSRLHHPNIVEYFDRIVNKETSTLYIIMEWCPGGDLNAFIQLCKVENKQFDESFIWRALYQISKALQVCHTRLPQITLLHRDIKPANIFVDEKGNFKLGDFGLAQSEDDCNCSDNIVGTPYYMSPEILKGRKYDRKSDIWALGCLIYELSSLIPPFRGITFQALISNIKSGRYSPIPEFYSQDLNTIISFMLAVKKEFRPTIEMIIHHPLVLKHVTSDLKSTIRVLQSKIPEKSQIVDLTQGISNVSLSQRNPEEISEALFKEKWISRLENLRVREAKLQEREEILSLREQSLTNKEKYLSLLERRTKERMVQAQLYLNKKNKKHLTSNENVSDISADPGDSSILPTSAKFDPSLLPKPNFHRSTSNRNTFCTKHVHFERKPLKDCAPDTVYLKGNQVQKNCVVVEVNSRLDKKTRQQSNPLEFSNKENILFLKKMKSGKSLNSRKTTN